MDTTKSIAVLTSGGDSPGMNAAIRAVTRTAVTEGYRVIGFNNGYKGVLHNDYRELTVKSVADVIQRGGTFLGTARLPEFEFDENIRQQCYENIRSHNAAGVVVLGGDGSFKAANLINTVGGIPTAGIPCTIDNDIDCSDFTIGFDTAANTCLDAINRIRDSMASHGRIGVIEIMGNKCGDLAIYAGISGGAEAIIIPEVTRTKEEWLEHAYEKLMLVQKRKNYGIIVMSEGMHRDKKRPENMKLTIPELVSYLTEKFPEKEDDIKDVTLGHIQRGGSPTVADRILASRLGEEAVKELILGKRGFCVGIVKDELTTLPISEVVTRKRQPNLQLFELADILAR